MVIFQPVFLNDNGDDDNDIIFLTLDQTLFKEIYLILKTIHCNLTSNDIIIIITAIVSDMRKEVPRN